MDLPTAPLPPLCRHSSSHHSSSRNGSIDARRRAAMAAAAVPQQQQQQPRKPTPTGPWVCLFPWDPSGGQGRSSTSSGSPNTGAPGGNMGWRSQGLLGPAPQQAYTVFAPCNTPRCPAAVLAARTNMGPGGSYCGTAADAAARLLSMGDGLGRLNPHALLGWCTCLLLYTCLLLTCFTCFYLGRQWFTYFRYVSRSFHPNHSCIKVCP